MGKINPENLIQFKSTQALFDRISKRLASFDAMSLIDTGDFHKHVAYVMEQLGQGVFQECEAMIPIKDRKGKLPENLKRLHAMYKCTPTFRPTQSINEQKPWVYMYQTEITKECKNKCKFEHKHEGDTKVVIRTFVNGDEVSVGYGNPVLLRLSPNVRNSDLCTKDCPSLFKGCPDEVTIDDNRTIHTVFDNDSIFMQYYGLPMDENDLPMIPVQEDVERAVEYYIYSQLFEEFYWNSTVPGIGQMLQDARQQYNFYIAQARYWAKLPSFEKMVNSIRKMRSRNKFYYSFYDRTYSN